MQHKELSRISRKVSRRHLVIAVSSASFHSKFMTGLRYCRDTILYYTTYLAVSYSALVNYE